MAFKVHKMFREAAFRVNNRFPVTNAETIPAVEDGGGISLMLTDVRLTRGTTSNEIIGVSQNKLAKLGDADGTVDCPFYLADNYIFKALQGAIADADVQPGGQLDINATEDGLEVGSSNNDVTVVGNHVEQDVSWVEFHFNNIDNSMNP